MKNIIKAIALIGLFLCSMATYAQSEKKAEEAKKIVKTELSPEKARELKIAKSKAKSTNQKGVIPTVGKRKSVRFEYEKSSNPAIDKANYIKAKKEWIAKNPEQYKAMIEKNKKK